MPRPGKFKTHLEIASRLGGPDEYVGLVHVVAVA
jgi:hypothetical protein